ncbi:MAG: glycosyltransferase family 4 protein [Minisyncoccota bacterium]
MPHRKKKTLYIVTKSNWGGAQRYVYDIATHLPKEHFDVVVACGGEGALVTRLKQAGIRVIPLTNLGRDISPAEDTSSFFSLVRIIRNEHPDIVHLNSAKAGGLGALAGRIVRVPHIIFTAHGWAWNEERPWYQKIFVIFFSWITLLLAHKTIAVSETTKRQVSHFPFVKNKIVVIKNGLMPVNGKERLLAREILVGKISTPIPSQTVWIGMIAELHKTKGISYAIHAIKILAQTLPHTSLALVIVGEGEERDALSNLIQELGLSAQVFLVGHVPDAADLMFAFDIFMLSSISEALAYVILEAGNVGLPVVATRVGGIPEIIENGVSGVLVPPRDPKGLAGALAKLIADPVSAKRMGEALKKTVAKKFSFESMLEKTIVVYTSERA